MSSRASVNGRTAYGRIIIRQKIWLDRPKLDAPAYEYEYVHDHRHL